MLDSPTAASPMPEIVPQNISTTKFKDKDIRHHKILRELQDTLYWPLLLIFNFTKNIQWSNFITKCLNTNQKTAMEQFHHQIFEQQTIRNLTTISSLQYFNISHSPSQITNVKLDNVQHKPFLENLIIFRQISSLWFQNNNGYSLSNVPWSVPKPSLCSFCKIKNLNQQKYKTFIIKLKIHTKLLHTTYPLQKKKYSTQLYNM
jgi:hypothetical protein